MAAWLHAADCSLVRSTDDRGRTPLHLVCRVPCFEGAFFKHALLQWLLLAS